MKPSTIALVVIFSVLIVALFVTAIVLLVLYLPNSNCSLESNGTTKLQPVIPGMDYTVVLPTSMRDISSEKILVVPIGGGIGNRLFQVAFAYGTARNNRCRFQIRGWKDVSEHSPRDYKELWESFFKLPYHVEEEVSLDGFEKMEEGIDCFSFNEAFSNLSDKNYFIKGYFQNQNYFKPFQHELRTLLSIPSSIQNTIQKKWKHIVDTPSFFIHVRLGDYTAKPGVHFVNLTDYYNTCIPKIPKNAQICVFSDEMDKIAKYYPNLSSFLKGCKQKVLHVKEKDELVSLYLMAGCYLGGITSNSTFSWWGAWLNTYNRKQVFMPNLWLLDRENTFQCPDFAQCIQV